MSMIVLRANVFLTIRRSRGKKGLKVPACMRPHSVASISNTAGKAAGEGSENRLPEPLSCRDGEQIATVSPCTAQ